jgi:molybdopterin-guanine dinucleotide biosynthesis protein A
MRHDHRGAIILCGGKSSRMGRDKATLPSGPDEVMLQRVVRIVSEVIDPSRIIAVAAEGQPLPPLPPEVTIARDRRPERGPLEGLAMGLVAIADRADVVYATSCDVPLLVPAFVDRLFGLISDFRFQISNWSVVSRQSSVVSSDPATDHGPRTTDDSSQSEICNQKSEIQIVVPRDGQYHHPLAAVYRTSVLPAIEELLAADRLRPVFLFEKCRTLEVPVDELRDVDPELDSLMNCNRPEDYEAALAVARRVPAR